MVSVNEWRARKMNTEERSYDAVIFDLDGTLLDTLTDLADSLNAVLQLHDLPLHTKDEVRRFVGNGIRKLIERAIPGGTGHPQYELSLIHILRSHFSGKWPKNTRTSQTFSTRSATSRMAAPRGRR